MPSTEPLAKAAKAVCQRNILRGEKKSVRRQVRGPGSVACAAFCLLEADSAGGEEGHCTGLNCPRRRSSSSLQTNTIRRTRNQRNWRNRRNKLNPASGPTMGCNMTNTGGGAGLAATPECGRQAAAGWVPSWHNGKPADPLTRRRPRHVLQLGGHVACLYAGTDRQILPDVWNPSVGARCSR